MGQKGESRDQGKEKQQEDATENQAGKEAEKAGEETPDQEDHLVVTTGFNKIRRPTVWKCGLTNAQGY